MAFLPCPRCGESGFTWISHEGEGNVDFLPPWDLFWACEICGYQAIEDPRQEALCSQCAYAAASLKDAAGTFWYCSFCDAASQPRADVSAEMDS